MFDDPQSADTRRAVMRLLGKQLTQAMTAQRKANREAPSPVHLVVPDQPTADVLVSIADNLAGVELSRLRWERDKQMGRAALTFNGEPATDPAQAARDPTAPRCRSCWRRTAPVRSRCAHRSSTSVRPLARHVVAGGPAVNSLRLDYLVEWAKATPTTRSSIAKSPT